MYNSRRREGIVINTNRCDKTQRCEYGGYVVGFQHAKGTCEGEKRDDYRTTYMAHRNDARQLQSQENLKIN
jgi:hypothetical protein